MRTSTLFISILDGAFLNKAEACRPRNVPIESRTAEADGVYVGYVTAVRYSQYEESLKEGDNPEGMWVPETIEIKAFVTQTLKGEKKSFYMPSPVVAA